MTDEGTLPKSDGDILWASEANYIGHQPQYASKVGYDQTDATDYVDTSLSITFTPRGNKIFCMYDGYIEQYSGPGWIQGHTILNVAGSTIATTERMQSRNEGESVVSASTIQTVTAGSPVTIKVQFKSDPGGTQRFSLSNLCVLDLRTDTGA